MKVAVIFLIFGMSFCSAKIRSHKKDIKNQSKTGGENYLNHVLEPNKKKLECGPSSIYSWFLKPLSALHSQFPTKKF